MRRYIEIDTDLCIGCNMCDMTEVCDWFVVSSGNYGQNVHRPAYLHCIYCMGECTQKCDQDAIMLVDVSGPHKVLCRSKTINNFMEE